MGLARENFNAEIGMVESESDANLRIYLEYLAKECAEKLLPAGCQDAAPPIPHDLIAIALVVAGVALLALALVRRGGRAAQRQPATRPT